MSRCNQCGKCCRTMLHQVNSIADIKLFQYREKYIAHHSLNGKLFVEVESVCKYLVGNKCKIHGRKPKACRLFPDGEMKEIWAKVNPDCGLI